MSVTISAANLLARAIYPLASSDKYHFAKYRLMLVIPQKATALIARGNEYFVKSLSIAFDTSFNRTFRRNRCRASIYMAANTFDTAGAIRIATAPTRKP